MQTKFDDIYRKVKKNIEDYIDENVIEYIYKSYPNQNDIIDYTLIDMCSIIKINTSWSIDDIIEDLEDIFGLRWFREDYYNNGSYIEYSYLFSLDFSCTCSDEKDNGERDIEKEKLNTELVKLRQEYFHLKKKVDK